MPLADISTPNRFELGWLTGSSLASEEEIAAAARKLGPREVVVTSATVAPAEIGMVLFSDGSIQTARQRAVATSPKGTGDLFAALYLGHRLGGGTAAEALQRAASAVARLAEQAAALSTDELPLASGQDAFAAEPAGITVAPWAPARGKHPA
jgi:pyridoxine kinase